MERFKEWWGSLDTRWKVVIVVGGLVVLFGPFTGEDESQGGTPEATASATSTSQPEVSTTETPSTTPPPTTTSTSGPTAAIRATTTTIQSTSTTGLVDLDVTTGTLPESMTSELFILLVREQSADLPLNWTDAWSDSQLRDFARTTCNGWDDGLNFEAIGLVALGVLMDDGWDSDADFEMLGYVIGAGTEAFCPEHGDKVG